MRQTPKQLSILLISIFIIFAISIISLKLPKSKIQSFKNTLQRSNINNNIPLEIAGGVVPHHLLAFEIIEKFFKTISSYQGVNHIVIFAPDHYSASNYHQALFLTTINNSELNTNDYFVKLLINNKIVEIDEQAILKDQGIISLKQYLQKYYPQTKITPILISYKASKEKVKELVDFINTYSPSNTIIIASVDFSHYLPNEILKLHDVKSIRVLLNFEEKNFPLIDVDSWQAIYGLRYYAKLKNQEKPIIISYNTSYDFFSNLPPNSEILKQGGTSYFSVIFENGSPQKIEQTNVLIVGDIMMGRGVQILTDRFGLNYPFENIINIFKGIDIVMGNFEGVLLENAPFISLKSTSFGYPLEVAQELKKLGFNLLNLSNNHSLDKGLKALEQTRIFFKAIGIEPLGDYHTCKRDFYYQYKNLLFIGANLVYENNNCVKEIVQNIKDIKSKNPDIFIILFPHWGTEYVHYPNNFQKNTAHFFIDNGVDLIIGHHPHVVQSIEVYKNKLIFYSLGNFVFDMYFSKAVQEGLVLGLNFQKEKVIIYLIPVTSIKSQLSLLKAKEKTDFLNWLKEISASQLKEEIISGVLIQNFKNKNN